MNIAIILAGGTGTRMGCDIPKQFLELDSKTVIEHSIDAFEQTDGIDEIAVVAHPLWMEHMKHIATNREWKKLSRILEGGEERYFSSLNAIAAHLDYPDDTNLILHDAARPWITQDIINRVLKALEEHEAVGVGVPSTDTIWEIRRELSGERFVARIPERKRMWMAQTPQAFRLPVIRDAYQRALQDPNFIATDDCGVVRQYMPDMKIYVVEGSEHNKKITFSGDIPVTIPGLTNDAKYATMKKNT